MMRMTKKPLLLALAALALGCGDPVQPDDGPGRLVEFTAEREDGTPPAQPEVSVFATSGRVSVEAVFATPDVCRRLTGKLYNTTGPADEPIRLLHVDIDRTGQVCGGMIGRFRYRAIIEAEPATFLLRVEHDNSDSPTPEPAVVFSQYVAIPR